LVCIGICGVFLDDLYPCDVVIAQGACTDSAFNKHKFRGMDYAPLADFELLRKAYDYAQRSGFKARVGNVLTSDFFYTDDLPDPYQIWQAYGILAVEMEAAALYTLAARFKRKALAILTVSNHMITGEELSSKEREQSFMDMVKIALEVG